MDATTKLPPCPFWIAASTDQRHVDPNAPAPLKADGWNDISAAVEHLEYHGSFSKTQSLAIAQLLNVAADASVATRVKGLFTQKFIPSALTNGLLDKALDTGMLNGTGVIGEFSPAHFEKMFDGPHASDYTIDGEKARGMSEDQLKAFVADNAKSIGAGRVQKFVANFEMIRLLLGIFGRDAQGPDGAPVKIVRARDAEVFFKHRIFPHARLDAKIAETFPSGMGADLATGAHDPVAATQAKAIRNACPFMGMMGGVQEGTPNPAFDAPKANDKTDEAR